MVNTEDASKLRECKISPQQSCETCNHIEVCPYVYCQKIDCDNCGQKKFCPMCQGNCKICKEKVICKIYFPDAKVQ